MSVPASPPVPVEPATVASWQVFRDEVAARLAPCVPRPETRRCLQAYLDGLLSDTRRKNGWAAGRDRRRGHALRLPAPAGARGLVGGPGAGRAVRLCWGTPGGCRGGGRHRRDGLSQAGGSIRRGWRGSTAARWARSATAKWGSSWPTSGPAATRCWTGSCICPRPGPTTRPGCRRWGWRPRRPSRPSRSWRSACWPGCSRPGCPWPG